MRPHLEPDFRAVFEATSGVGLLLAPDAPRFTVLAVSDDCLAAMLTTREAIVGRPFVEVFADASATSAAPPDAAGMRTSLEQVLATRSGGTIPESTIDPLTDVPSLEDYSPSDEAMARRVARRVAAYVAHRDEHARHPVVAQRPDGVEQAHVALPAVRARSTAQKTASGVAGDGRSTLVPSAPNAAAASRSASRTQKASIRGGSPTALEP